MSTDIVAVPSLFFNQSGNLSPVLPFWFVESKMIFLSCPMRNAGWGMSDMSICSATSDLLMHTTAPLTELKNFSCTSSRSFRSSINVASVAMLLAIVTTRSYAP